MKNTKRIAVLGFALESNAFAPTTFRHDFEDIAYAEDADVLNLPYVDAQMSRSGAGFGAVMSEACDWEAVPILFGTAGAGGPCDHDFFLETCDLIRAKLCDMLPVDGVYIIGHGAGLTTECDDMDGAYFELVRDCVGPNVPVIATLDLHGNISEKMVSATDCLIAFQTNPHLDMVERSADAARIMLEMFAGMKPKNAFIRLPLITPQISQLTLPEHPYGELIIEGQSYLDEDIANVSILSGFAFSDTPYNGMAVIVTARQSEQNANKVAQAIATKAWENRHRYKADTISLEEAVYKCQTHKQPLILADVADNPGGGGRGNTTFILQALHAAKIKNVQYGLFYDPDVVEDAWSLGEGAWFEAHFAKNEQSPWSKPFKAQVKIVKLLDEPFHSELGMSKGLEIYLGRSCLLQLGSISIVVISIRQQIFAADVLQQYGLVPEHAACIVVKSRGHFRAGFAHIIDDENVFHVDVPGLTTPNLNIPNWVNLLRPVYPLDPNTQWP